MFRMDLTALRSLKLTIIMTKLHEGSHSGSNQLIKVICAGLAGLAKIVDMVYVARRLHTQIKNIQVEIEK